MSTGGSVVLEKGTVVRSNGGHGVFAMGVVSRAEQSWVKICNGVVIERSGWSGISAGNGALVTLAENVALRESRRRATHCFGDPQGRILIGQQRVEMPNQRQSATGFQSAFRFFAMEGQL